MAVAHIFHFLLLHPETLLVINNNNNSQSSSSPSPYNSPRTNHNMNTPSPLQSGTKKNINNVKNISSSSSTNATTVTTEAGSECLTLSMFIMNVLLSSSSSSSLEKSTRLSISGSSSRRKSGSSSSSDNSNNTTTNDDDHSLLLFSSVVVHRLVEVFQIDAPIKLQQAYLNIINILLFVVCNNSDSGHTIATTATSSPSSSLTATAIVAQQQLHQICHQLTLQQPSSSSSSFLTSIMKLTEQGSTSAMRGKAFLCIQLLCRYDHTLLSYFVERRLATVLCRHVEPLFKKNSANNIPLTTTTAAVAASSPVLSYSAKTAVSMILYLKDATSESIRIIQNQLSLLSKQLIAQNSGNSSQKQLLPVTKIPQLLSNNNTVADNNIHIIVSQLNNASLLLITINNSMSSQTMIFTAILCNTANTSNKSKNTIIVEILSSTMNSFLNVLETLQKHHQQQLQQILVVAVGNAENALMGIFEIIAQIDFHDINDWRQQQSHSYNNNSSNNVIDNNATANNQPTAVTVDADLWQVGCRRLLPSIDSYFHFIVALIFQYLPTAVSVLNHQQQPKSQQHQLKTPHVDGGGSNDDNDSSGMNRRIIAAASLRKLIPSVLRLLVSLKDEEDSSNTNTNNRAVTNTTTNNNTTTMDLIRQYVTAAIGSASLSSSPSSSSYQADYDSLSLIITHPTDIFTSSSSSPSLLALIPLWLSPTTAVNPTADDSSASILSQYMLRLLMDCLNISLPLSHAIIVLLNESSVIAVLIQQLLLLAQSNKQATSTTSHLRNSGNSSAAGIGTTTDDSYYGGSNSNDSDNHDNDTFTVTFDPTIATLIKIIFEQSISTAINNNTPMNTSSATSAVISMVPLKLLEYGLVSAVVAVLQQLVSMTTTVITQQPSSSLSSSSLLNLEATSSIIELLHTVLMYSIYTITTTQQSQNQTVHSSRKDLDYNNNNNGSNNSTSTNCFRAVTEAAAASEKIDHLFRLLQPLQVIDNLSLLFHTLFILNQMYLQEIIATTTNNNDMYNTSDNNNSNNNNNNNNNNTSILLSISQLMEIVIRCLGILFDLFPQAVSICMTLHQSTAADEVVVNVGSVIASVLSNHQLDVTIRSRLLKLINAATTLSPLTETTQQFKTLITQGPVYQCFQKILLLLTHTGGSTIGNGNTNMNGIVISGPTTSAASENKEELLLLQSVVTETLQMAKAL